MLVRIFFRGCMSQGRKKRLCINPDAHNVDGLKDVEYGVGIARKGWLEKKNVVNAWSAKEVDKWFVEARK